jgi:hypothetical protein
MRCRTQKPFSPRVSAEIFCRTGRNLAIGAILLAAVAVVAAGVMRVAAMVGGRALPVMVVVPAGEAPDVEANFSMASRHDNSPATIPAAMVSN